MARQDERDAACPPPSTARNYSPIYDVITDEIRERAAAHPSDACSVPLVPMPDDITSVEFRNALKGIEYAIWNAERLGETSLPAYFTLRERADRFRRWHHEALVKELPGKIEVLNLQMQAILKEMAALVKEVQRPC